MFRSGFCRDLVPRLAGDSNSGFSTTNLFCCILYKPSFSLSCTLLYIPSLQNDWYGTDCVCVSQGETHTISVLIGWLLYLFSVFWIAGLMFTSVFFVSLFSLFLFARGRNCESDRTCGGLGQVIMFSDLETDYLNPIDFCNKMNQVRLVMLSSSSSSSHLICHILNSPRVSFSSCSLKASLTPS